MDDKHVAILIRNYRRQLDDAIDAVREAIPEDAPRYEVKNIFGNITHSDYAALKPLHTLIDRLNEDIAALEKEGEDANGQ